MKYSEADIHNIHLYKESGLSGREIARILGLSKSGVNAVLKKKRKNGPKILFFDAENAPSIAVAFQRFNVNITPDQVLDEGGWLLSIAWQWGLHDEKESLVLTPKEARNRDDSRLCKKLYKLFEEADIIVAHNGKKFDVPLVKTRILANGLPAPKIPRIIDTLLIARSLSFNSNKLDSLCHALDIGRKMKHHGIRLWIECMEGKKESLQTMVDYNVQDIDLLVELYLRIRAYDKTGPNLAIYYDDDDLHCPTCGGTDLYKTGNQIHTNTCTYNEYVCNDCGHRSRGPTAVNTTEHRKNLLRRAA